MMKIGLIFSLGVSLSLPVLAEASAAALQDVRAMEVASSSEALGYRGGVVEGVLGIAGVILGFTLSELLAYLKQRHAQTREIQLTRTLIRLEIDHNLTMLREEISTPIEKYRYPADEQVVIDVLTDFNKYSVLAKASPPLWSHAAWQSQMPLIPKALSDEEVAKCFRHHADLDRLNLLQQELVRLETKKQMQNTPHDREQVHYAQNDFFNTTYMPELREIINLGNPLTPRREQPSTEAHNTVGRADG